MTYIEKISQKTKTILVTGGAGAIGSNLVKKLLHLGVKRIIVLDNLSSGLIQNLPLDRRLKFLKGDITHGKDIKRAFSYKPEIVFHLAANFANQRSIDNPTRDLEVNGMGTLNLLEVSLKQKIKNFVYFSSSCVYGHKDYSLKESDTNLDPATPYAITKLLGEHYCLFYYKYYNLPVVILRIFNSFGPGEPPGKYRNVIPNFIDLALKKKPLPITGTGKELRTFTFVEEVVKASILASLSKKAIGRIINIASKKENEIKLLDLAKKINALTANVAGIKFVPARDWDTIKKRRADITLMKNLLKFKPDFNFDEKLKVTIDWLRDTFKY